MTHRALALAATLAVTALSAITGAGAAEAAPPAGACQDADPARPEVPALPWAQQVLNPQRAWPFTRGSGVRVAVVDSGVDADHPQLRGPKVAAGHDFTSPGALPGAFDCDSHGTEVAGIIAANPVPGIGFSGVAPDAGILPVRITDRDLSDEGQALRVDPQVVANGIHYAADQGAQVINLSLAGLGDVPAIRDAVAYAEAHDAVVVAAAGNAQQDDGAELPSYPAGYDGVLGVGAVDINGARMSSSQIGGYVDLVAPGVKVLASTRVAGHRYVDGTSFATAYVSGTAALVRAAWPRLNAAQVIQRLLATASPARGGQDSAAYGSGLVNAYRAVTDGLDPGTPAALPAYVPPPPDRAMLGRAAWQRDTTTAATWLAGAAAAAIVLAAVTAAILPRGRRRRWRPTRTPRL